MRALAPPSPWGTEDDPRYLAAYELDADNPGTILWAVDELRPRLAAAGRMFDVSEARISSFLAVLGPRQEATPAATGD